MSEILAAENASYADALFIFAMFAGIALCMWAISKLR